MMKRLANIALAFALALAFAPIGMSGMTVRASADELDAQTMAPSDADNGLVAQAANIENLRISGVERYDLARKLLDIINNERKALGKSALKLDANLTTAAMQRAAELSVLYSTESKRPDGRLSFSASNKMRCEVVSAGQVSEEEIRSWFNDEKQISEWDDRGITLEQAIKDKYKLPSGTQVTESTKDLWQPNYYRWLVSSDFKSIGIGCFYQNGKYYWEEALGIEAASGSVASKASNATHDVRIDYGVSAKKHGFNMNLDFSRNPDLAAGETFTMTYCIQNAGLPGAFCVVDPSSVTWKSSNTDACTIDEDGVITAMSPGKSTVTATLPSGKKLTHEWTVNDSRKTMYRMYNPNSGEHFYTASAKEKDSLVKSGWRYEGVGWIAPSKSETPVYRLYSGTDHHYTTSAKERDSLVKAGWKYEGIGWYSDDSKKVALYRQFNPNVQPTAPRNNSGSHNYTTSKTENDSLVKAGWKAEGIGWYGIR